MSDQENQENASALQHELNGQNETEHSTEEETKPQPEIDSIDNQLSDGNENFVEEIPVVDRLNEDTDTLNSCPTNAKMSQSTNNKREILAIKKDLETKKLKSMSVFEDLETEKLTLQESALMAQNQILKQQHVLMFALKEICKEMSNNIIKHYEEEITKVDGTTKELFTQNNELEDVINYISDAIEESKADFLEDSLIAVKLKVDDGLVRDIEPPSVKYAEFSAGEMNTGALSSMVGKSTISGLTEEEKQGVASKFLEGSMPLIQNKALTLTRGTSAESSNTQISGSSDHNSVATQTDGEGEQGSMGITEGGLLLTANIDDIENSIDRCAESTPVNVKGLSWRIVVYKHWRDQLQIRLYFKNLEVIDKCVEYVEYGYSFKLVNHKNDTWTLCKKESRKIGRDAWWDNVISWPRLEDPQNGYAVDKWITVEAKLSVEEVKFY